MFSLLRRLVPGALLVAITLSAPAIAVAAEQASVGERAAANQPVEFDVFLPLEHRAELEKLLDAMHDPSSPSFRKWLQPAEFNARFGASPAKIQSIEKELQSHGLIATQVAPRQIHVAGRAAQVERVFAAELKFATLPGGRKTVAFSRPFLLPSSISAADAVVTGLSGKIRMRSHAVKLAAADAVQANPENRYSATGGYFFTDLKQAYSFPSYQNFTGEGVTVGVLMTGSYLPTDMAKYFGHEKVAAPNVVEVKLAGGAPFGTDGSVETALDLQQTGGMAPKAQLVLFNLPDLSDSHILSGLVTIVESNVVDVLSMSFGGPEHAYSADYNGGQDYTGILAIYDDIFAQGNAQGITFVASSGDSGALAIPPLACFDPAATSACGSMQPDVETPASSPHVTGVGGTNLVTTYAPGSLDSAYVSENAYGDPLTKDIFYGTPATGAIWGSGGGDSFYYRKPLFQRLSATGSRFRTVPDVSLHMGGCPQGAVAPCGPDRSFDYIVWNNGYYGVIGTSASAPDFAGLLALKIERFGSRMGNENYDLYALAALQRMGMGAKVYREGVPGYNGFYETKPGYDRVLGIGTIRGNNFLQPSPGLPEAGVPQSPSNP